ncbi:substrate-binding domain-containing protein [Nesterenkonia rhizosphaerae]|uniref:Substrate-binding domain-containing protein n=1 Tax=Nesterenkonia rhizosphaerae TaxID=1348272 RepID=A0ABP9G172_9MICC
MRESAESRRRRITTLIQQHGDIRISDLAGLFHVSAMTIRRDVEMLVEEGAVQRRHGRVQSPQSTATSWTDRLQCVPILVPAHHPYLQTVAEGARDRLESQGYRAPIRIAPDTPQGLRNMVEKLQQDLRMDGLIVAPRWNTEAQEAEDREQLARLPCPAVLLERPPGDSPELAAIDSAATDHRFGVRLAVEDLVRHGHRRILLATRLDSPTARSISTAFAAIAQEHPLVEHWDRVLSAPEALPRELRTTDVGESTTGEAAHPVRYPDFGDAHWLVTILRREEFSAVLIHSDVNALVLVQQLVTYGVDIPGDCAVIAYDDVVASHGLVPLTAVAPPKIEVGQAAAGLMSSRLQATSAGQSWTPQRIQLLPSLRVRSSS